MKESSSDDIRQRLLSISPFWILLLFFFILSGCKVIISGTIGGPHIFVDELAYNQVAQQIYSGALLASNVPYPADPFHPGYSFIISLAYLLTPDKYIAYHYMLIINSLVTSTIIFPSYYLLRSALTTRVALAGAILIALLPSVTLNSFVLMSEALFIPLTIFSIWFVQRSFSSPGLTRWDMLLSFSLATLFFTRAAGISMVIALAVTVILTVKSGEMQYGAQFKKKIAGMIFPGLILHILWIIDQLAMKGTLPKGYSLSSYCSTIIETWSQNPGHFIYVILLHVDYLLLGALIVFPILAICTEKKVLAKLLTISDPERESLGLSTPLNSPAGSYAVISSLFIFLFGVLHMWDLTFTYPLCGRYIDPIIPIVVLGGIIGLNNIIISGNYRHMIVIICGYLIGLTGLTLNIALPFAHEPNNNIAIFYLYSFTSDNIVALLALIIGGVLTAGITFAVKNRRYVLPLLSMFMLLALVSTIPITLWEIQISKKAESLLPFCQEVNTLCPKGETVLWDKSAERRDGDRMIYFTLKFWLGNKVSDEPPRGEKGAPPTWLITNESDPTKAPIDQGFIIIPYQKQTITT